MEYGQRWADVGFDVKYSARRTTGFGIWTGRLLHPQGNRKLCDVWPKSVIQLEGVVPSSTDSQLICQEWCNVQTELSKIIHWSQFAEAHE